MAPFTTRPEIRGTFGVCASTHYLATAAGMAVLENGGNAFELLHKISHLSAASEVVMGGARSPWAIVGGVSVTAG